MGRLTRQIDWLGDGTNAAYDRTVTYNGKGQVTYETVVQKQGADTIKTSSSTTITAPAQSYALGAITYTSTVHLQEQRLSERLEHDQQLRLVRRRGAVARSLQAEHVAVDDLHDHLLLRHGRPAHLASMSATAGRAASPSSTTATARRSSATRATTSTTSSGGDPHEIWYRFGGKQLGYTGNNGTLDTDYATSITNRTLHARHRRLPLRPELRLQPTPISTSAARRSPATARARRRQLHGARGRHALQSIAAQLWGDSSLWYKLAEANGIGGANALDRGPAPHHPRRSAEEPAQRLHLQAVRPRRDARRRQPDHAAAAEGRARRTSAACSARSCWSSSRSR